MGNDIDVTSKDPDIDEQFWRYHGPKNESTFQFFRRGFDEFCSMIASPKRSTYSSDSLGRGQEFHVYSYGIILQCCKWEVPIDQSTLPKRCLVYLHTNTRNLGDAMEILGISENLNANLIAFDLPGCGKSEGIFLFSLKAHNLMILQGNSPRNCANISKL